MEENKQNKITSKTLIPVGVLAGTLTIIITAVWTVAVMNSQIYTNKDEIKEIKQEINNLPTKQEFDRMSQNFNQRTQEINTKLQSIDSYLRESH